MGHITIPQREWKSKSTPPSNMTPPPQKIKLSPRAVNCDFSLFQGESYVFQLVVKSNGIPTDLTAFDSASLEIRNAASDTEPAFVAAGAMAGASGVITYQIPSAASLSAKKYHFDATVTVDGEKTFLAYGVCEVFARGTSAS